MHMADALLSPSVGGAMWAVTAASTLYCSRKIRRERDDYKVPLMGVLGAFIFAAQMINFTIPGTGSSGHLGGGMILTVILGPHAAFLVMASVLTVQALFFADGGLLALGANIFNLGFIPCFIAYPFFYKPLAGREQKPGRIMKAAVAAAVVGLQLGALAVVVQTVLSGISELPFASFLLLMLPIHLAIGLVEGLATAAVLSFVWKSQPEFFAHTMEQGRVKKLQGRKVLAVLGSVALLTGVALSWFASTHPDGLEWSIAGVTGSEELRRSNGGLYEALGNIQEKTALLPEYGFRSPETSETEGTEPSWPAVDPGTSVAGVVGSLLTLLIVFSTGWLLRRRES